MKRTFCDLYFMYSSSQVKLKASQSDNRDTLKYLFKVACYYLLSWTYLNKYLTCNNSNNNNMLLFKHDRYLKLRACGVVYKSN